MPHDRFYQTSEWTRLRRKVLDQAGWRCSICGADLRPRYQGHVHHRFERKIHQLVELEIGNLQALCGSCHSLHHHGNVHRGCDETGMPIDPRHSWNVRAK